MFRSALIIVALIFVLIPNVCVYSDESIPIKALRRIELPKGYHEGLLLRNDVMWVNNGNGGKTWVVKIDSGEVVSEITPAGTFCEGITPVGDDEYWMTDWDTKKLYLVKIEESKMVVQSEVFIGPSHPAGVIWNGSFIYVIMWQEKPEKEYSILKMSKRGNVLSETKLDGIKGPSQLAWDGEDLWISGWLDGRVYKVDDATLQVKGYFNSPVAYTTGITWDGEYLWLTGTSSDLYKIELLSYNMISE